VTTNKRRITVYLHDAAQLDALREEARRAVPIELRGQVSASTCVEAAVTLALAELRRNGAQSAMLAALVTLPRVQDDPQDAAHDGAKRPG
jgi:hypothetical protein